MISDECGVAGFFEDLPVLIIVLGGVCILVLTASTISAESLSRSADERVKSLADALVERILSEAIQLDEVRGAPLLYSVARMNLTECAEAIMLRDHSYRVVLAVLHPDFGQVLSSAGQDTLIPERLAVSSALIIVMDESARPIVVEIRVMVWENASPK